jgi:beta-lactamase class A
MVLRDDGNTASLLFDNIDQPSLNDVFSDLGIDFTESKNGVGYLSIKQYALVFRVLYNSTYLNRDLSEEALSILSNTKSSNGVAAGIDPNLSVAHLYELTQVASTGAGSATADKTKPATYEAYDCGIVYYPGHPYEMCATVTTTNAASIPVMFQSLNKAAYENMQDTYPTQN